MLRKSLTTVFCVAVLFAQSGSALALVRAAKSNTAAKKKVVTNVTVNGPVVKCHQWGFMEVQLKVTKTEVTGATGAPSVTIKINSVSWPIYPTHTPRSIYINAQALPLLQGETLPLHAATSNLSTVVAAGVVTISGATHTTVSWRQSLQGALVKAATP